MRWRPELAEPWEEVERAFPVRITRSWWERVDPRDPCDPLARQVVPDPAELEAHPDDLPDPVGDLACSPVPWVVHKYPDRVLLMMTRRCLQTCRYCFRRARLSVGEDPTEAELQAAVDYAWACGAGEVILSGGDPLVCGDERLLGVVDALRPAIPVVRIHTRAPVVLPERIGERLVEGLRARAPVWVVVGINHPRELGSEVDAALSRMVDGGVPVLAQTVLLAGVNDEEDILADLWRALVERRVAPYYLHHPDPAPGNAHFRVSLERGLELVEAARDRVGGLARPRYVIDPPDGSGKVSVRRWVEER